MQARVLFDLEKHGEDQLALAIRRLPPGGQLTINQTGLTIMAMPGGARRFRLRVPPKLAPLELQPEHDAFKAAATATTELVRLHEQAVKDPHQED